MMAELRDWLRSRERLMATYRLLPKQLRRPISRAIVRGIVRGTRFDSLPPASGRRLAYPAHGDASEAGRAGVNLFAYFRGRFGLAEAARAYSRALLEAGYPVAMNDIALDLPHDFNDTLLDEALVDTAPFDIGIVFVNPDYIDAALRKIGEHRLAGRPIVVCWFWELTRVPDAWIEAISHVDAILVSSLFIEQAFRGVTEKPVHCVPLPLFDDDDSGLERRSFGLDPAAFVLLASFDFHSWIERKNPLALIEAFRSAFPAGDEDVCFVIKTSNGARYPDAFSMLVRAAGHDTRIQIRDDILDRPHLRALQRCCDVYVSLHRAEGFGLGLAECMLQGKPVIATAWSGNMQFMNEENSCLVGYKLIDVPPGGYVNAEGQQWADPDVAEAAAWMRRLWGDRDLATRIGEQARASIRRDLAPELAAQRLSVFLDAIRARSSDNVRVAESSQ